MADRDDLDYFMEHAILSKDLRDLADRARAIRERERGEVASLRLAVLVYEELLVDLGFGECTDRNEAVAIRDRERKLAGLARERYELLRHFVAENVATTEERTELRRYENAIK